MTTARPRTTAFSRIAKNIGRGLGVGVADLVPGVSGATIALIMGIYEKLVFELSGLLQVPRTFSDLRSNLARDWAFLIPLGIGILTAILIGAAFIPTLVETQPLIIFSLFSGLIASSAVVLARDLTGPRIAYAWIFLGAAVGIGVAMIAPLESAVTSLGTVIAGAAAIAAMLLPGVSGSYVLLLLGYYTAVFSAIAAFDIGFLSLFALGALAGAAVSIVLISRLLKKFHLSTMLFLLGIVAGALGKPLGIALSSIRSPGDWFVLIGCIAAGIVITLLVSRR